VRRGRPIPRSVRGRDAHGHRWQAPLPRVAQDEVLGRHPGLDVRAAVIPVVRILLRHRRTFADRHRASGAGEDEPRQAGLNRNVEHMPESLDVGAEQRRRVAQPHPGVDDAVVHNIAAGHGRPKRIVVEEVSVAAFDREVIDPLGGTRLSQHHANVFPVGHQPPHDVRADKATGADHEFLHLSRRALSRHGERA
jgi:hypothetical protein